LKADDQNFVWPSTPVALKPRLTSLQVNYAATSLLIPDRVGFRYRLDGYDKGWIDAGSRRQAFYSKLPPGSYTFTVIASNDSGVWNDSGASLSFTVAPTFAQTIWFKSLCALALVSLLFVVYRLRVRQLTSRFRERMYERLAERERIARDLHDTFFQAIQGLLLRFHTATSRLHKDEPARVESVQKHK
jgi:signal transduction histidine kinase